MLFTSLTASASIDHTVRFKSKGFESAKVELGSIQSESLLVFDMPIAYNKHVKKWIHYFQTRGRTSFKKWLQRSSKHVHHITTILEQNGLPKDLFYLAMIESGFYSRARSHANAVGPWQFIKPTAERYGLKVNWWLDERKDFDKSTKAAAKYLSDLYGMFDSWYLAAASYNTGENRVKKLVKKYKTKDFWKLVQKKGLYNETKQYIPKWIAAALITKAPHLYGFRDLDYERPIEFEHFVAPGGTDLKRLADHLGVTRRALKDLNPELKIAYIPKGITGHRIRIPRGSRDLVSGYFRTQLAKAD